MKKSLFFSAIGLGLGLLSCSQEDLTGKSNAENMVSVSVSIPELSGENASRAIPTAPDGHKLRCIMVVDYEDAEDLRMEKVADGTEVNGKFRFSFAPENDNYTCRFWADYIDTSTQEEGGKYTDKYYNTSDLTNITYKAYDNSVFNNPACDAFYGNSLAGSVNAILKRPFAKLTLKDSKSETVNDATSITITYSVPTGFNVSSNTTADKQLQQISYTGIPADKANSVWFYNYVFAPANVNSLGDITMTVNNGTERTLKTESLVLTQNYDITASIDFASADGNINVDVDIDDEYNDPDAPKVGQFLQKDGTFSDTYDAEKSIAIVFATGAKGEDIAANYGKDGTKIWGYAMGLSSTVRTQIQDAANTSGSFPDLTDLNGIAPWAPEDYSGYVYTNNLINKLEGYESILMQEFGKWKEQNLLTGIDNVSTWYIPSARQLLDLVGMSIGYAGGNDGTITDEYVNPVVKNDNVSSAVSSVMGTIASEGKSYFGNYDKASNIMSSYVRGGRMMCVQTSGVNPESISKVLGVTVSNTGTASPFTIRPVITIFKPAAESK